MKKKNYSMKLYPIRFFDWLPFYYSKYNYKQQNIFLIVYFPAFVFGKFSFTNNFPFKIHTSNKPQFLNG